MKNVEIKFTNDLAKSFGLPENATKGSAGFDLRAIKVLDEQIEMNSDDKGQYFEISPNQVIKVSSGISIHLNDPTLVGLIFPRSGTSTKQGIVLANVVGVVDSDYQGDLILALRNQSDKVQRIYLGERLAQYVVMPIMPCVFNLVDEFSAQTERGQGGFGSSGKM